ncbi:MAG: hypothetical protein E4H36_10145 [Spirochaetales bacterium]|nr:MAG: hypothetical protein E4H36_10145 [Spirochaetales bacterium]
MSDEERDQFFKDLAQEAGEPVEVYALGEIREGLENLREPLVGLFYTTEHWFFFQTFPRKNWFTSVMGSFRKKKEEKPLQVKIPLSAVRSAQVVKPKSFWQKIFTSPIPVITVEYSEGTSVSSLKFSILAKEKELVDWINTAITG